MPPRTESFSLTRSCCVQTNDKIIDFSAITEIFITSRFSIKDVVVAGIQCKQNTIRKPLEARITR